jgi:hypothetical protein
VGVRSWRRGALGAAALAGSLLFAPAALGSAETVIGFDHYPGSAKVPEEGTKITGQWESEGLRLGTAAEVGDPAPGEGNCGAPSVASESGGTKADSQPNYALLARCVGSTIRGTYGALPGHPRGALTLAVRSLSNGFTAKVKVTTYDAAGEVIAETQHANVPEGEWTPITVVNPASAQLSYFSIVAEVPNLNEVGVDNITFEAPSSGTETTTTTTATTPSPPPPPPPPPPVASLALTTPHPHAGEPLALSGAASTAGSGRIISFGWNFSGGQKPETSTGTNPVAHVTFGPGVHTVTLTVTNSDNEHSTTSIALDVPRLARTEPLYEPDGGEGECQPTLEIGDSRLLAKCIQKLGGGYVIEGPLQLNGMMLVPQAGASLKIRTVTSYALRGGTETELYGGTVAIELDNTPIGNVVLGQRDLEAEPMVLELNAIAPPHYEGLFHGVREPGAQAAAGGGGGGAGGGGGGGGGGSKPVKTGGSKPAKTFLFAFAVGEKCEAGKKGANCCPTGPGTSCAELPGNFPLKGQVTVYATNKAQVLVDVQVGLSLKEVHFEATGALELEADFEKGVQLSSLKFEIGEASLAPIFTVKKASFEYFFPEYFEESKRDSWQAKGTLTFGEEIVELEAELAFKKGNFQSAAMKFKAPHGGVPIFTGVLLNEIGASVAVEPTAFGGSLGASIVESFELELEFKFREKTSTELGFFGGKGILSLKDHEIASLAADVYTDGYMDAQLKFHIQYPFESSEPFAKVEGELGFWDEPATAKWEADGFVAGKLWVLEAEIGAVVNNTWFAGCGAVGVLGAKVGGYGFYNFTTGESGGQLFPNNCKETLEPYKEHPAVKHSGGFVGGSFAAFPSLGRIAAAGGESETIALSGNPRGEDLRISASSGSPVVTIVSPSGQTLTTPSVPGKVVGSGSMFAALAPDKQQVIVLLKSPQRGEWRIERAPGSGPISKVEGAGVLPAPTVRAHARRRGRHWLLAYRINHLARGMKVQLLERGRDSNHLIATVHSPRGSVPFTPQEALSRPRQIVTVVLSGVGAPVQTLTVGRYTAPGPFRPARPRRVHIARRRNGALVTWSAVAGARRYRVRVLGSDGRLETHMLRASVHSVAIPNVLGFESFAASVTAVGGKNLLEGATATGRLAPVKPALRPARGRKRH